MSWERVLLPDIESGREFAESLDALGYSTRLATFGTLGTAGSTYAPELVLIGGSVTVEFAVRVISLALEQWGTLRFALLTSDEERYEPEERHYEILVGAPLTDAARSICLEWMAADWEQLDPGMPLPEFHSCVRNRYSYSANHTRVDFIGGPRDGEWANFSGSADSQPKLFFVTNRARGTVAKYERRGATVPVQYHFVESTTDDGN